MSEPNDVSRASERLVKQIELLGELRNAGARDQRFKLWRQDTLTLLQRLWPGDHVKAERFRRIPFSAPMAKTDRGSVREYFERGCKEASVYLDGLAFELGLGVHGGEMMTFDGDTTNEPAAKESEPTETTEESPFAIPSLPTAGPKAPAPTANTELPAETPVTIEPAVQMTPPAEPFRRSKPEPEPALEADQPISFLGRPAQRPKTRGSKASRPSASRASAPPPPPPAPRAEAPPPPRAEAPPVTPPMPEATPTASDAASEKARPRMRLKDMLGFSDAAAAVEPSSDVRTPHSPEPPVARPATSRPVTPPASARPPAPRPSLPTPSAPPPPMAEEPEYEEDEIVDEPATRAMAAEFILDSPIFRGKGEPVKQMERTDTPSPNVETPYAPADDEAFETVAYTPPSPPPAAQVLPMPLPFETDMPPSPVAEEIYTLATAVADLGVPPAMCGIMRATLIDLGRQLETPPIHWTALRESVALAMQHPELARRLLPLVLPYLQQAA